MSRFGILANNLSCVLCERGTETRDHIFFQCPTSGYIWKQCRNSLGIPGNGREGLPSTFEEILALKSHGSDIYNKARIKLLSAMWHIWRERNRRIFEGVATATHWIINNIESDASCLVG